MNDIIKNYELRKKDVTFEIWFIENIRYNFKLGDLWFILNLNVSKPPKSKVWRIILRSSLRGFISLTQFEAG